MDSKTSAVNGFLSFSRFWSILSSFALGMAVGSVVTVSQLQRKQQSAGEAAVEAKKEAEQGIEAASHEATAGACSSNQNSNGAWNKISNTSGCCKGRSSSNTSKRCCAAEAGATEVGHKGEPVSVDAVKDTNGNRTDENPDYDVPSNAPENCPGIKSETAGKSEMCSGCPNQPICSSGELKVADTSAEEVKRKLESVKKKILVLSGKGGVGKSSIAAQLSWALESRGFSIGLMDIDVCGPSIPMMTGCKGYDVHASADGWSPVYVTECLAVMSIGFLLPKEDDAVIWRGPKKNGLIRQFLTDVLWGDLDVLIIDTPPGTSDEHLSIVSYLSKSGIDGAIVITTPQEASLQDVRKEINFCKKVNIPIIGVIENMTNSVFDALMVQSTTDAHNSSSSSATPTATAVTVAAERAAVQMCRKLDVAYCGAVPLDKDLIAACEMGKSLLALNSESPALKQLNLIIDEVLLPTLKLEPTAEPSLTFDDA